MLEIKRYNYLTYLAILLFAGAAALFCIIVFIQPDMPDGRQRSLGVIYLCCLFGDYFVWLNYPEKTALSQKEVKIISAVFAALVIRPEFGKFIEDLAERKEPGWLMSRQENC